MSNNKQNIKPDIWAEFEEAPLVSELIQENAPIDFDADAEYVSSYLKAQFIEDIYRAMENLGLNKQQLAKKTGKSAQYIGRILNERANFTLESIAEIACSLGMKVSVRMYTRNERMTIRPALSKPQIVVLDDFVPATKPVQKNLGVQNDRNIAA